MIGEQQNRWLARLLVWQLVIGMLIGWNVHLFTKEWTNWNLLSFVGQAIFVLCARKLIRQVEELIERGVASFFALFEE